MTDNFLCMTTFQNTSIEQVRGYWDRRPCNLRHSPLPVGTRGYFDQVRERKYLVEPHIPAFADFPAWAGKRVLEIGCGMGTDTISFAQAGARVTAVDLSENSLKLARQRAQVYGLADRITFYHANAEQLGQIVPVEPYDLVYSFGVIHHTPHPERALAQLRAYVRPGGQVKIMVYHRRSWKVLGIVLAQGRGRFWQADRWIARHSEAQTGCPVTYTYTRHQGRKLLQDHGLRVTDLRVEHIFPYRIKDYVQYRYVKEWWFRCLPAAVFRGLEHRLGWHLCLTATTDA